MARPGPKGNAPGRLFPRVLKRLAALFIEPFAGLISRNESGARESALQHRVDALRELLEALLALEHFAVDEEGRRRIDLQYLGRKFLVSHNLVEQRLILQAILNLLLGE